MPIKTEFTSKEKIISTALPHHGSSYAVIPHKVIIEKTKEELDNHGLIINNELYKTTFNGNVAQGIYHLNHGKDPDMGLMFAWSNSYDKTMTFKCSVGAVVFACLNNVVHGDLANYSRKHTGTAKQDAFHFIHSQISDAAMHYDRLVEDKEMLKDISINKRTQATIAGILFAEEELLTLTQLGIVKREMDKPSFNYNAHPDSAWSLYNHITFALKESHPKTFLDDHARVHRFFVNQFGLVHKNFSGFGIETTVQRKPIITEKTQVKEHVSEMPSVLFL